VSGYNSQSVEDSIPNGQRKALPRVTMRGILVALGLSMYVASFFLWAVVDDSQPKAFPMRGYYCADFALFYPLGDGRRWLLDRKPLEYFSLLGSGLINPVFLTTFFLQLRSVKQSAIKILKVITILMIPLCWVVFRYEQFYPREGHVLWIAGMLLTLFVMSGPKLRPSKERQA
jgi:hypothetical protein